MPREFRSKDPNLYTSPFLVRAAAKGMFNIDMGMITSLSISKGAECCWNVDGLPTQIDISITIEDLYSSLHSSGYSDLWHPLRDAKAMVENTAYQDYLANMAGLNIAQMEVGRKALMYTYLVGNRIGSEGSRSAYGNVCGCLRRHCKGRKDQRLAQEHRPLPPDLRLRLRNHKDVRLHP